MALVVSCGALLSCAGILGIEDLHESGSGLTAAFVSGGEQSGEVGKELGLPLVVRVLDANGAPAANRKVTFAATAGGGYFVDGVTATTDPDGRAQARWVLGPAQRNEIAANVEDVKATAKATATNPWQLSIFAGQTVGRMFRDGNAAEARFGAPSGLAVASDGKVYVGDTLAHSIRQYDPVTQQVSTIVGSNGDAGIANGVGAAARFMAPYGLTMEGNGRLLVASAFGYRVGRIDLATNEVNFFAGRAEPGSRDSDVANATFNQPYALDWDKDRNVVYVVEGANHDVREINLATSQVTTLAGKAEDGRFVDGPAADARFNYPLGVTHNGNKIYIADRGNSRIRVLDRDAKMVSTLAGGAGGYVDGEDGARSQLVAPSYLTYLNNSLYVADRGAHAIRQVDVSNGAVKTIAGSPPSAGAPKFGAQDGPGAAALLFSPWGVAAAPDGKALYVGEAGGTALRRIELNATFDVRTVAAKAVVPTDGDALTQAIFSWPRGLALVGGKLIIAENQGNAIRELDLATKRVRRIAGPADEELGINDKVGEAARFAFPTAMVANEAEGTVYVAGGDQLVRQVKVDTGATLTVAGQNWTRSFAEGIGDKAAFFDPTGFALDAQAQKIYIADSGNHRIRVFDIATRAVTTLAGTVAGHRDGPGADARFSLPRGIALKDGNLYVADTGNHVIRRIAIDGANGAVTVFTIAGIPTKAGLVDGPAAEAMFAAPWSLAVDGDLLYVADVYNRALRRIHLPGATVSTLAGGATAGVEPGPVHMPKRPNFLVVRPGGEVFFTTEHDNVVFRLGPP